MIGFISGFPIKVYIHGIDITLAEIDFFCMWKKNLNQKSRRLAPVLIQEVSIEEAIWEIYGGQYILQEHYYLNPFVKQLIIIEI